MAQKLHDTYGFSYDKLKVLLGGWNTWNQEHEKDPEGYPTEVTAGADTGGGGGSDANPIIVTTPFQIQPAPAGTVAP